MAFDKAGLLNALIFDVALPEITAAIRRHHAATGELPTDDQVVAALQADRDRIVSMGETYLASHGFQPAAAAALGVHTGSTSD